MDSSRDSGRTAGSRARPSWTSVVMTPFPHANLRARPSHDVTRGTIRNS
jgi:hypothetical protein